ncbi:hypothetical protein OO007_01735 [Cocleimonas sp. KMM 6892]|uniref:hypothetical protein n=1 Tax=unclassified Cocleimonas TaxID=2639732 RepID=UPI002DBC5607|nr:MULTISPECIES: hypothetical protein [unclassified Cocleimonas]MEB8430929.1 hypothetical protein [Cocleimonas sp. KMM 6892]MEC4714299.1 hypothetical protein [Cocleimonas sp. KMM 6895]MEC4743630.1 hypothetical protein [Cocleimonas sp. KMM 6896]
MKYILSLFFVFFQFQLAVAAESAVVDRSELETRVSERWGAFVNHKFGDAYKYATPTYRAVFTKDLYVSQFSHGIDWNLTKIADIKYDPATSVATVIVLVETKPKNSKGLSAEASVASVEIREKWLHIKGQWWHSSSE